MSYTTARGVAIEVSARTDQARRDIAAFSSDFGRGMRRNVSEAQRAEAQIRRSSENIGRSLRSSVSTIATAAGFIALAKNVATATREATAFEKGLTLVAGSAEAAARQTEELKRIANELGVEYRGLRDPFLQFAASAKGKGVDTIATFEALTRAGVALGRSTEEQGRAFVALSQSLSKGQVKAEELTGQLGEALPGALDIAARSFGVTTRQMLKMVEDGGVPAAEFVRRFTKQLEVEFPKGIEAADAGLNRLRNTLNEALNDVGEGGFFSELNKGADELSGLLRQMNEDGSLEGVATGLTSITTAIIKLTGALGQFWKENPRAAMTIMGGLTGAMVGGRFGPYGAMAGGAIGAAGGFKASEPTKDVSYYNKVIGEKLSQIAAAELTGAGGNGYSEAALRALRGQLAEARAARARLIAGGAAIPQASAASLGTAGSAGATGGSDGAFQPAGKKPKGKKAREFQIDYRTDIEDVPETLARAFEDRFKSDPLIVAMLKEAQVEARTLEERVADLDAAWVEMMNNPEAIAAAEARKEQLERVGDAARAFTHDLAAGLADALVYGHDLGDVLVGSIKRAAAALIESQILDLLDPQRRAARQQAGSGGGLADFISSVGSFASQVFSTRRASGGHVSAGRIYRINEGGIEGFQPAGSGKVIPLGRMRAAAAGGGVTVVQPLNVSFAGAITTPELMAEFKAYADRSARQAGRAAAVGALEAMPARLRSFQQHEG